MEVDTTMSSNTKFGIYRNRTISEHEKIKAHEDKLDFDQVPKPKDLTELCTHLHRIFDNQLVNVEYVTRLLENYKSNAKDWRQYAKYDPHKYTRNLIDEGNGKFNVLLLCWAESQGSSIHDHSNSHCFMKCLDGELVETKYEWPSKTVDDQENSKSEHVEREMIEKGRTVLKKNDVCYINDSIGLHRVENQSHTRPGITLHVYVPAYSECRGFDRQTGKAKTCQITFYSKYGNKVVDV